MKKYISVILFAILLLALSCRENSEKKVKQKLLLQIYTGLKKVLLIHMGF